MVRAIGMSICHSCVVQLIQDGFHRLLDTLLILGDGLAARSRVCIDIDALRSAEIRLRLLHPRLREGHFILFQNFLPFVSA
jgi:hypothetical protein